VFAHRLPSVTQPDVAQAASAPVAAAPVAETAVVEVRNGTPTTGLAKSVAQKDDRGRLDVTSYSTAKTSAANTFSDRQSGEELAAGPSPKFSS